MSERPFDSAQGALPAVADTGRKDPSPAQGALPAVADTGRMIQVGVTALRDPVTGEFLPAVPLFIREKDAENPAFPKTDGGLMKELSEKMKEYHEAAYGDRRSD